MSILPPPILQDSVICGDCLEEMRRIPSGSIDLILCDPPYGVCDKKMSAAGARWDSVIPFEPLWKEWLRVCKPTANIVLFGSGMFTADVMKSNPRRWRYNLVWKKGDFVTGFLNSGKQPLRNHEDIMVFNATAGRAGTYNPQPVKGVPHKRGGGRPNNLYKNNIVSLEESESEYFMPRSVLDFSRKVESGYRHPSQKPVPLLEWLVKTYSNEGDTVLDSCCGSGSTLIAAINTARHYIGIERDKEYCEMTRERVEKAEKKAEEAVKPLLALDEDTT